jgi:RNA polymerase sigma-70 factor (ECF subfamily)
METEQTPGPPDDELVRKIQAGNNQAFELLARRYYRSVFSLVAAHLSASNEVEDVVQDTFLRVLDRIQSFDARRPFPPWLYQVARNLAKNHKRRMWFRKTAPLSETDDAVESASPGPADEFEQQQIRQLVAKHVEKLPQRQRTAFRLFEIEEYSADEVGQMMGLNATAVRSNVYQARRTLNSRLASHLRQGDQK